jgi:hypothetical protein
MARPKHFERPLGVPFDRDTLDWLEAERDRTGVPTTFFIRSLVADARNKGLGFGLVASVKDDA